MLAWCGANGFELRLIETMPMGEINGDRTEQYLPLSVVRSRLGGAGRCRTPTTAPAARRAISRGGDRAADRLHHADDPQFLRELQSRAADLHGHTVHVPGPGGCGRFAPALRAWRERRGAG